MTIGDTEFAFSSCNLSELNGLNCGVSPEELPYNTLVMIITILIFSNSCDKIIDENIHNLTNCKYYTADELKNSNSIVIILMAWEVNLKICTISYQMRLSNLI